MGSALDDAVVELAATDSEEVFFIDRILAERRNEYGDMEYLVSWEGYQDVSWLSVSLYHFLTTEVRIDLGTGGSIRS